MKISLFFSVIFFISANSLFAQQNKVSPIEELHIPVKGLNVTQSELDTDKAGNTGKITPVITMASPANSNQKTINQILPEMLFVRGGSFMMGDDSYNAKIHEVILTDFHIGKYEVTLKQFKAFIEDTKYQTDADTGGSSYVYDGSWGRKNGVNWKCDIAGKIRPENEYNHPVIHVSWNDATAYANWLSKKTGKKYRLPTEAQWEYAAGGGVRNPTKYAGTADENELKDYAWYHVNSYALGEEHKDFGTHSVGTKKPNELGIYDMSGNIWEWCRDLYWGKYYKNSAKTNPENTVKGSKRVFRGGSWNYDAIRCRVAYRDRRNPDLRFINLGFRMVLIP